MQSSNKKTVAVVILAGLRGMRSSHGLCCGEKEIESKSEGPIARKKERHAEVSFMVERNILSLRPVQECLVKTGKTPTTARWVDSFGHMPPLKIAHSLL